MSRFMADLRTQGNQCLILFEAVFPSGLCFQAVITLCDEGNGIVTIQHVFRMFVVQANDWFSNWETGNPSEHDENPPNVQPPPSQVSMGMSNPVTPPPHYHFTNTPPPPGSSQITNPTSTPPPMAGYGTTATPGAPNSYPPPPPSGTGGQHQPDESA